METGTDPTCPYCTDQAGPGQDKCKLLMSAYVLAGLAMMLNIRLAYSSAPYALIRFQLPENLFSVFVRRMASALELWCLPSMLLGNIMELALKGYYLSQGYTSDGDFGTFNGNLKPKDTSWSPTLKDKTKVQITFKNIIPNIDDTFKPRQLKFWVIIFPSIVAQWLNFLTYVILFFVYVIGDDQGHLTLFYLVIAISGFVFGINMVLVYAADWNYTPVYIAGENSFPIVTSFMHYVSTLIFGNRRKYNSDFIIVMIDIWVAIIISLVAAVVWTLAYGIFRDTKKEDLTTYRKGTDNIPKDINVDTISTITITITDSKGTKDKSTTYKKQVEGTPAPRGTPTLIITKGGETETKATFIKQGDTVPTSTQCVTKDTPKNSIIINYTQGGDSEKKCITITANSDTTVYYGHIFTETFDTSKVRWPIISPTLMVIVGMGLVYAIYPGIAPGMIVPFYLIDKIEMVLLIATFFPPVIVALLNRGTFGDATKKYSPKTQHTFDPEHGFPGWTKSFEYKNWSGPQHTADATFWHAFDILIVLKISLATIFIYSLHYRDSSLSRSIVNQPKMSTALSIIFYMCHECLLALGFAGVIGNNGGTYVVLPAQYVGALFMLFLAFYSIGYVTEYKRHDPSQWPTDGMTTWNALYYWLKMASKLPIKIWHLVFTHYKGLILTRYYIHTTIDIHNIYYKLNII